MRSVLVALAAFAAGVLVGHLATPSAGGPARAWTRASEAPPRAETREEPEAAAVPPPGSRVPASPPRALDHPPDEDRPLDPGTEFGAWDDDEFLRWYAVHRKAWDLPDLEEAEIRRRASAVLALGRIPRRDVLLVLLDACRERDRAVEAIEEESQAWFAANPPAPRKLGDPDPALVAYQQRIAAVEQRCFDRLHRELAYSDYLLLQTRSDGIERRPPPGGPLPGGDPYARPIDTAKRFYNFSAWYRAYGPELGFPERDEDFLAGFHQHVVLPLGRIPEPALMLALEEAYLPVYPRLREGSDEEATVRAFFESLDKVLAPLDYERMRHSHEWKKTCRALAVPEASYFAGR